MSRQNGQPGTVASEQSRDVFARLIRPAWLDHSLEARIGPLAAALAASVGLAAAAADVGQSQSVAQVRLILSDGHVYLAGWHIHCSKSPVGANMQVAE